MLTVLAFEIIVLTVFFLLKGKYTIPDEQEFKKNPAVRFILPLALFLVDRLVAGKFTGYERRIGTKLSELYRGRDVKRMLRLHLVYKTVYLIAALLAITLLGISLEKPGAGYLIFAICMLLLVFYTTDREIDTRIKRRNFLIRYDFPDFLNKLVLLINAGMTVPKAWEKIVRDRKEMTPLYEELNATYLEIRNGKPETAAYEDFARRCRVREITKFIAAIIQNLKKGNSDLVPLLKLQANECWQNRKNMARRLGEEASTKLVLPLVIMFAGIIAIVLVPAIMQLKYL